MESSIFRQIVQLTREHKTAARATAIFLCLALVVAAVTMGVLTSTGHAMTQKVKVLTCPLEVHQHTPECRNEKGDLICGYADYVVHIHNDDCYGEDGALVCTLREVWPHTHQDSCYEELRTPVCGQEEAQPHVHTEACYAREQGELLCTQAEHTHGPDCYLREEVLTCDKTEQEHVHSDDCYTISRELSCGLEESEEHTHADSCYTEVRTLTCDKTTEPHVHGPECYTVNETLTCTVPEHTHADDCYAWTETLICGIPEGQIPEGGHVHTDACYETSRVLSCGQLEMHEHTEDCFEHDAAGERVGDPICGQLELLEHVHGEDCFTIEEREVEDETQNSGPFFFETTGEDPEVPAPEYICGLEEHTHDETCLDENGEPVCGLEAHTHDESCLAPAPEAEAAEEPVSPFICGLEEHLHSVACLNEAGEPVCGLEEHVHDASCLEAPENGGAKVYRDGSVLITAVYPAEAMLPEDVTLRAARLTREENLGAYENYLEQMQDAAGDLDLSTVVLYDIGFYTADDQEIEPQATVNVSIQFLDESGLITGAPLTVVHFAQEGAEVLESVTSGNSVSFDADSFSPFIFLAETWGDMVDEFYGIAGIAFNSTSSLEDYIGGMKLQKKGADGGWVDMDPDEGVVLGNNYRLGVDFDGNKVDGGFEKEMTWDLGNNVQCKPVTDVPLYDGSTLIGHYTLTEDGQLTVTFEDSFIENGNQKLHMDFDMTVQDDKGDEDSKFPWSGHIKEHNKVEKKAALDVEKSAGNYSTKNNSITYTVTATVTEGMIKEGTLKDEMANGTYFRDYDVGNIHVYDAYGNDLKDQDPYKGYIEALEKQLAGMENGDDTVDEKDRVSNFELKLPPMTQGMRFEIEYECFVPATERDNAAYVAENTVTFSGKAPEGGTDPEPKSETARKPIGGDQITKTGDVETLNGKSVIKWTVRIGSGKSNPLGYDPLTVTDTLGSGLSFLTDEDIQIRWLSENGTVKEKTNMFWKDVTISEDGKTAEYDLKLNGKGLFSNYKWANGDYIEVTYYTDYDISKQPSTGFENTITNNLLAPDGVKGKLPVGEDIIKTVVDDEERNCLHYTIKVDVLPCSDMKQMEGDDPDKHASYAYFYLYDELDFSWGVYVMNIPENVRVYADSKVGSQHWDFANVPWTSAAGDGQDRQTFQILRGPESEGDWTSRREAQYFRVYFNTAKYGIGTDGKLDHHDSIWDIDTPTTLTITYDIPYDSMTLTDKGVETGKTLLEQLNELDRALVNTAYAKRSGAERAKEATFKKETTQGSIDKTARILNDGIVEYRVTFVNSDNDPKDSSRLIKKPDTETDTSSKACNKLKPTLTDMFDKRMQYVEGSLKVEVRNKENDLYATYKYMGENLVSGNTLTANLYEDGDWQQLSNDGKHYTKDEDRDATKITDTFDEQRKYVFVYQLQLNETARKDWEPDNDIHNEATFTFTDYTSSDDATVDIPSDMLQKNLEIDKGVLKYTLNVNSLGADLVQVKTGESYVNLNSYKLVDKMSENLQLLTNDDGTYAITVEYREGDTWHPLTQSADPTGISPTAHNYYLGSEEDGIYFILPDQLPIRIVYQVKMNGSASNSTLASNEATLYADTTETDRRDKIVQVGDSGGYGSSDPVVRLEKQETGTGKLLEGAKFDLYSSERPSSGEPITVTLDVEEIKMYKVASYETDAMGAVNKITPPAGYKDKNALYALIETAAPSGHVKDADPQFFRFPNYDEPVEGGLVTYMDQTYEIKVMKAHETLTFNNPPEAYTLPESGGEGLGPLYAVGIAMMALSAVLLLETKQRRRKGET